MVGSSSIFSRTRRTVTVTVEAVDADPSTAGVQVLEGRRVFEHLTPDENLVAASAVALTKAASILPPTYATAMANAVKWKGLCVPPFRHPGMNTTPRGHGRKRCGPSFMALFR